MPQKRHRFVSSNKVTQARAAAPTVAATPRTLFGYLGAKARSFKKAIIAIAGVGALLGGLAGYWNAYQAASGIQPSLIFTVGNKDAGPLSLVVLPLKNLTGDPSQGYLADGLTSALTADVSRNRNTFVVSTVTAFAYKDRLDSVQRIGRELGVRFVMSGGVQRRGQQILLTAQLADTTNGAEIWNETFSSDNADLPSLQDSVTRRIANSIGLETLKAAARTIESRPKNPSAVDLVLKARAIIYTTPPSQRSTAEAIELYRKAIAIDPAEMQAVVGLAVALAFSADNGFAIDSAQKELQLNESRELALRAKSRVPEDALVFYVLAVYASHHGDFEGARRNDEAALNLEPMSPYRYANLADDYLYAGQTEQAIPLLEQALKLSPRKPSWGVLINIGRAQLMIGQERSAIEWLLKARDATPLTPDASVYLAAAYARLGQMDKSRAAAAEATRIKPSFRLAEFEPPKAGYPAAYRIFWENKLLPACRLAGL